MKLLLSILLPLGFMDVQIHESYVNDDCVSINCSHIMRISFAIVTVEKFLRIKIRFSFLWNETFSATFAKFPFLINQRKSEFYLPLFFLLWTAHERKIFLLNQKAKVSVSWEGDKKRASFEPQNLQGNGNKEPKKTSL